MLPKNEVWLCAGQANICGREEIRSAAKAKLRLVIHECEDTGMAVSIDTDDAVQLHPRNKRPLGICHAYLASKRT